MKLTNNSGGPRAIHTTDRGTVVLQPGQSDDLEVDDANAKAIKQYGLLEPAERGRSLAEIQREIASSATPVPAAPTESAPDEPNLPAEDDAEVVALVDGNTADELQKIVDDEKVDVTGARTKTDAARRIVAARRAAAAGA